MILGNLYRQKGQVGRAITVHQGLLQRPDLRPIEHAHVLLCLGPRLQARRVHRPGARDVSGGGAARSEQPVRVRQSAEALRRSAPVDRCARRAREDRRDRRDNRRRTSRSWASCATKSGASQMHAGDDARRPRTTFETAIDIDSRTAPAYLNLGDARERQGKSAAAVEAWERLVRRVPDRAYLAFDRLERAYRRAGTPRSIRGVVRAADRRATRRTGERGSRCRDTGRRPAGTETRSSCCSAALPHNPHGLAIHQEIWQALLALDLDPALVQRYMELTRERGLLPGSPRLHPLPVPQHRAALAVPAVPRMEHVRRGTDVDGQGFCHGGARRLATGAECWTLEMKRVGADRRDRHGQERGARRVRKARCADHRRRCVVHARSSPLARRHLAAILARFGDDVADERHELDRRRLGSIVFADESARRDLERIVHPAVQRDRRLARIDRSRRAQHCRGRHSRCSTRRDANASSTSSSPRPAVQMSSSVG